MRVFVVIVVYNKAIADLTVLKTTHNTNYDLLIYDNSPNPQAVPNIEGFNLIYQHDTSNAGVSRAYNVGALKAKELGCDVVLLLDQDTVFSFDCLSKYEAAYAQHGADYLYAPVVCNAGMTKIYSPAFINHFVGKAQTIENFAFSEKYSLNDKSAINSGLMVPLVLFEKIGGFNEKLKLDFSDYYFIEKYKTLNENLILLDVYLKHSISGDEGKRFTYELNRYRYYCYGARELQRSLNMFVIWSPIRRLLRLSLKYKSLKFFVVFYEYFIKNGVA
jgi:GT2 family glycosyltransferase